MFKFSIYLWTVLITWHPFMANSYLNVFISHHEVMKLMGLEADLFYVHEGAINTFAMHFTVPVPADVHDLEFSWQSLTTYPLPYAIVIEYDIEQAALAAPTLSIPHKGYVPQQIEAFLVHLPCTGNLSAAVPLSINVVVRGPPRHNDTRLYFKRNKICLKGLAPVPNQSPALSEVPTQQGHVTLGVVACGLGLLMAIGLIAGAVYVRARKQIRQDSLHPSFPTVTYGTNQNGFLRNDNPGRPPSASGSYATITSLSKYPADTAQSCGIFERFLSTPASSPYATALLPMGDHAEETIYSKLDHMGPPKVSYYASTPLLQKRILHPADIQLTSPHSSVDRDQSPLSKHWNEDCSSENSPTHQKDLTRSMMTGIQPDIMASPYFAQERSQKRAHQHRIRWENGEGVPTLPADALKAYRYITLHRPDGNYGPHRPNGSPCTARQA